MTAMNVSQNQNKKTSYDELLQTIKNEHKNRAKELIPQLCYALKSEDHRLSKEDIRDRIKHDLIDIWSRTTIQENIPDEFKDKGKQEAKQTTDENKNEKKVIESSVTPLSQVIEQSLRINGTIETSSPITPDPIQEAQHTEVLQHNPTINADLAIPKEKIQKDQQEEKNNPLQSVVDKVLEEKQNLQLLFERSERENQNNLKIIEQLKQSSPNPKLESITEVSIQANDLMKVLINRAMNRREPFVKCRVENGIAQLPKFKD
jgi:hypothetical protein